MESSLPGAQPICPNFYCQTISKQYSLSAACKIRWESSGSQWIGRVPTCYQTHLGCLWTNIYLPMGQVTHSCCARCSNQTRVTLQCSQSQNVQRHYLPMCNQDSNVPVSEHRTKELIYEMSSYITWIHVPSQDCTTQGKECNNATRLVNSYNIWIQLKRQFIYCMNSLTYAKNQNKWVRLITEFIYYVKSWNKWIHLPCQTNWYALPHWWGIFWYPA